MQQKIVEVVLDGIVNNAGSTQDNLAIRMSSEEWQKHMLYPVSLHF